MEPSKPDFNANFGKAYEHKFRHKSLFVVFFIILVVFILVTTFSSFSFTAFISNIPSNESLEISCSLDIPNLELKDEFERISLSGISGSNFNIENVGAQFSGFENKVVLENFEGKIYFNSKNIYVLDGKAERVLINGNPFYAKDNKSMKVEISSPVSYSSLIIKNSIYLKKLHYVTSGKINIDNNVFNLNNEEVLIRNFYGDLEISETANFNGYATELKISGNSKVSIS